MWDDNRFVIDIQVSYPGGWCQGYLIIRAGYRLISKFEKAHIFSNEKRIRLWGNEWRILNFRISHRRIPFGNAKSYHYISAPKSRIKHLKGTRKKQAKRWDHEIGNRDMLHMSCLTQKMHNCLISKRQTLTLNRFRNITKRIFWRHYSCV